MTQVRMVREESHSVTTQWCSRDQSKTTALNHTTLHHTCSICVEAQITNFKKTCASEPARHNHFEKTRVLLYYVGRSLKPAIKSALYSYCLTYYCSVILGCLKHDHFLYLYLSKHLETITVTTAG